MTLRTLADEIKLYGNDLTEQRRRDLLNGLNFALSDLFRFFYKFLEAQYILYKQAMETQVNFT
jgi:hypothetical protein